MRTFTHSTVFIVESCCKCGVLFGLTDEHRNILLSKGSSFFCPNGHSQVYVDSEAKKLRKAQQKIARLEEWRSELVGQLAHESRRLAAQRGVTTRIKNRIGNGVCPCCKRTFKDLAAHMESKHPKWAGAEERDERAGRLERDSRVLAALYEKVKNHTCRDEDGRPGPMVCNLCLDLWFSERRVEEEEG